MSDKILEVLTVSRVSVIHVILERLPRHCFGGGFNVSCVNKPFALNVSIEKNEVTGVGEGKGGGMGSMYV